MIPKDGFQQKNWFQNSNYVQYQYIILQDHIYQIRQRNILSLQRESLRMMCLKTCLPYINFLVLLYKFETRRPFIRPSNNRKTIPIVLFVVHNVIVCYYFAFHYGKHIQTCQELHDLVSLPKRILALILSTSEIKGADDTRQHTLFWVF